MSLFSSSSDSKHRFSWIRARTIYDLARNTVCSILEGILWCSTSEFNLCLSWYQERIPLTNEKVSSNSKVLWKGKSSLTSPIMSRLKQSCLAKLLWRRRASPLEQILRSHHVPPSRVSVVMLLLRMSMRRYAKPLPNRKPTERFRTPPFISHLGPN